MRSPAERLARRTRIEDALRVVGLVALVLALVLALGIAAVIAVRGPRGATIIRPVFAESPSALVRDSLAALQRAGREVPWREVLLREGPSREGPSREAISHGAIAPLIAMAEPVREPGDRWRVSAVGAGPLLALDSLGPLDSLEAASVLTTDAVRGAVRVTEANTEARVRPVDRVTIGRIVVLGRAGWEPRFAITALEEAGWRVDARLTLGRERDVLQGDVTPRIARHAAAIVFDTASLAREAPALLAFVRDGGGVILAGDAARAELPAFRAIVGARVTALQPPTSRTFEMDAPTGALPLYALGERRTDAVVIEEREGSAAVVARRVGAGRVIQLGYAETWRWRMEGEGRAIEGHRAYWSRLVGEAAAATATPRNALHAAPHDPSLNDPAPRASLVQALGAASLDAGSMPASLPTLPRWLGILIIAALLAEWASRRGRGAA